MNKIIYIIGCCLCWLLAGCEQKLDTWSGKDVAYFDMTQDSTTVSFVYMDSENEYAMVNLRVKVMGTVPNQQPRYVTVKVAETNATAGMDFIPLEESYEIEPEHTFCDIPVFLIRSEILKQEVKFLNLELIVTSDFDLLYREDILTSGSDVKYSKITHRITFHEMMIEAPKTWKEYYFGAFSPKKFQTICDVMGISRSKFLDYTYLTYGRAAYIANSMINYLNAMKAAGTPVLDNNGEEMRMGDALY